MAAYSRKNTDWFYDYFFKNDSFIKDLDKLVSYLKSKSEAQFTLNSLLEKVELNDDRSTAMADNICKKYGIGLDVLMDCVTRGTYWYRKGLKAYIKDNKIIAEIPLYVSNKDLEEFYRDYMLKLLKEQPGRVRKTVKEPDYAKFMYLFYELAVIDKRETKLLLDEAQTAQYDKDETLFKDLGIDDVPDWTKTEIKKHIENDLPRSVKIDF